MPFTIERNDLVQVEADAVVVAANEYLQITGGVGLPVALAAGYEKLQTACDEIGFCPCGSAVATPGFDLGAKTIIHAVGPIWQGGNMEEIPLLRSTYDAALDCAASAGAASVALPLISAGTYGFPADISLSVAREAIRSFLNTHDIDIHLVLYSREAVSAGIAEYMDIAEYIDDHYVDEHLMLQSIIYADRPPSHSSAPAEDAAPSAPSPMMASAVPTAPQKKRRRGIFRRRDREAKSESIDALAAPDKAEVFEDAAPSTRSSVGLEDMLNSLDEPFSTTLLALIDKRGMTDAQVYKRANMSRQLFSKIRSDADYRPTKKTALALVVALGLNITETRDLLARAGFALSNSSKADVIVEYFIMSENYDIFEINEALYAFDQPLL